MKQFITLKTEDEDFKVFVLLHLFSRVTEECYARVSSWKVSRESVCRLDGEFYRFGEIIQFEIKETPYRKSSAD